MKNDWIDKVYCSQVTVQEFENQKLSSSQQALRDLLDNITKDEQMSDKEKKKRLKEVCVFFANKISFYRSYPRQFKTNYPEIYSRKFKEGDPLEKDGKPTLKQSLLQNPIIKFKGLRN